MRRIIILKIMLFNYLFSFAQQNDSILSIFMREADVEFDAIQCEKSWENKFDFASIIKVDDRYIMYYRSLNLNVPSGLIYCYAESTDGIYWTKPSLGVFEYNGNKKNNIISDEFNGASFEYKEGTYYLLADRIYKKNGDENKGLYLLKSCDGKVFLSENADVAPMICDSQNQLLWDKWGNNFKWYFRSWSLPLNPKLVSHHSRERYRSVSYFVTKEPDVSMLSNYYLSKIGKLHNRVTVKDEFPVIIRNVKSLDFDIYNPCVHQYGENLYIAYPTCYYHVPDKAHGGKKDNDGYGVIALWVSTDGEHFFEMDDHYMTNGNNWLEFCIGHVETKEYYIHYYITFDNPHKGTKKNTIKGRIHYKKQ